MESGDPEPSVSCEPERIGPAGAEGATTVSRFERMQYFERLVELHLAYSMRVDDDRMSVITIAEAIEWAESELAASIVTDRDSEPAA
jgi:hypothetical protein